MDTIKKHKRIIFNGNNYCKEWTAEAEKRGLLNLKNTAEALPYFTAPKNIELFRRMGVFTEREAASRQEIMQENYCKVVNIECLTMLDMAKKDIYPAVAAYITDLCACVREKRAVSGTISVRSECELIEKLSAANESMYDKANEIEKLLAEAKTYSDVAVCSVFFAEKGDPRNERTPRVCGRNGTCHRQKVLAFPDLRRHFVQRLRINPKASRAYPMENAAHIIYKGRDL